MLPLIQAIAPAAMSLFGGLMGQSNQADINAQNVAMQEQINQQNIQNQDALNAQNIAEQEKFAQTGIQWRAADARAAGISPLAALGAQTASFSNNVGVNATAPQVQASNALGTGLSEAGQSLSRAMQSMQSPEDKAVAMQKTALDLENGQLQNDLLRKQIYGSAVATTYPAGTPPGLPPSGVPIPMERPDPTANQETVLQRDAKGDIVQGPNRVSEGWSWSDPWASTQYMVRNQIQPMFGYNIPPEVTRQLAREQGLRQEDMSAYKDPFSGSYYGGLSFMGDVRKAFRYMRGDFSD